MILIKDRHLGEFHKLCPFSSKGTMILIKDYVFGVICFCFELLLFDWLKRTSEDVLFNLFSFRLINLNCLTYKK